MFAEHSNSYSSGAVISSSKKKSEKPPFKLCFSRQQQIGRSDACVSTINANFITPKFYSREMESARRVDVSDTAKEIAKEENKKPKDLYRWPILTSHTYGWWHDKGIISKDPRFNFHRKTTDMVNYQMRIYAEDRKLKGLDH